MRNTKYTIDDIGKVSDIEIEKQVDRNRFERIEKNKIDNLFDEPVKSNWFEKLTRNMKCN
jgi:hypothetical protein